MGNSQTKEARQQGSGPSARHGSQSDPANVPTSRSERGSDHLSSDRQPLSSYTASGRRGSRPDLSFLGIGGNNERDVPTQEARRETKQEREARKLEKERVVRLKERERSMKEEHVDGGYLVTQGVYVGTEDYSKAIVRQLVVGFALHSTSHSHATDRFCRLKGESHRFGEALMSFRNHGRNISLRRQLEACPFHQQTKSLQSLSIRGNRDLPPIFEPQKTN